jgi:hypothetical protein
VTIEKGRGIKVKYISAQVYHRPSTTGAQD